MSQPNLVQVKTSDGIIQVPRDHPLAIQAQQNSQQIQSQNQQNMERVQYQPQQMQPVYHPQQQQPVYSKNQQQQGQNFYQPPSPQVVTINVQRGASGQPPPQMQYPQYNQSDFVPDETLSDFKDNSGSMMNQQQQNYQVNSNVLRPQQIQAVPVARQQRRQITQVDREEEMYNMVTILLIVQIIGVLWLPILGLVIGIFGLIYSKNARLEKTKSMRVIMLILTFICAAFILLYVVSIVLTLLLSVGMVFISMLLPLLSVVAVPLVMLLSPFIAVLFLLCLPCILPLIIPLILIVLLMEVLVMFAPFIMLAAFFGMIVCILCWPFLPCFIIIAIVIICYSSIGLCAGY